MQRRHTDDRQIGRLQKLQQIHRKQDI